MDTEDRKLVKWLEGLEVTNISRYQNHLGKKLLKKESSGEQVFEMLEDPIVDLLKKDALRIRSGHLYLAPATPHLMSGAHWNSWTRICYSFLLRL